MIQMNNNNLKIQIQTRKINKIVKIENNLKIICSK